MGRFLSAVALLLALTATPASAGVLAVCGNLETLGAATYGKAAMQREPDSSRNSQIALWQDAKGFDILVNWGEQRQRSLRADGAEIMGNAMGADLFHLVVARSGTKTLEHFLFSLDDHSVGELLWTAASDTPGEELSYEAACIKPK